MVDKVLLAGLSSLLNKRPRELKITMHDSCEENRLIEHGLGYMVAIKWVQITQWQDEASTMGSIIGENVIQPCKERTKSS